MVMRYPVWRTGGVHHDELNEAVARLRDCLNDLVSIMAVPALWTGGKPPRIVSTSLDALRGIANDLEERVARQTSELQAANQLLKEEVAERRRTEEALRANELNFQLTVDTIPGMVHTMTATGGVEFVNHQILDFFGKTLEQLNNWEMLVHPDDRSRVVDLWTRSVATGEPYDAEHRVLRADGTYRWLHSRGLPLRDISGNIVRWYNLLTDIDERKRAEEALRASERNLKLIIDTIPALAWSARPDGGGAGAPVAGPCAYTLFLSAKVGFMYALELRAAQPYSPRAAISGPQGAWSVGRLHSGQEFSLYDVLPAPVLDRIGAQYRRAVDRARERFQYSQAKEDAQRRLSVRR
jgi:PAS domain S-box-containing protein